MELNYKNVKDFWNERCKRYGHTGYADQLRYAYDQPLRLRAVKRALSHLGIPADKYTCILDVGCGEGTFVFEFGRKGASVTGIDISSEALKKVKERAKKLRIKENIHLLVIRAQDINFPEDYFDLVLCVTVLQHIINPDDLSKAVKNIVRTGKWLLILETSPPTPLVVSSSYMVFKTRKEWIDLFRSNDCDLIYELPLPQEGSRFVSLMSHFLNLRNQKDKNKKRTPASMTKANEISKGQRMILNILRLTDYLFLHIPYPKGRTLYRILVFKKS